MQNIEQIIKKIEKLEGDFEMLNSRILEFANSTKKESLDFELLNFYIESLQKFKDLASKYKKELEVQDFKKAEYRAKQEIFIFRLEKLEKIFDLNIEKLKLISKTQKKIKDNNYKKNTFSSKSEMIEVERSIYEFYKEYEKNLGFQKKYNIKISLNNDFENKIEKEFKTLDLIKKEKEYLKKLNKIFEEIELLIDDFYLLLESLKNYENILNFYGYKIENHNSTLNSFSYLREVGKQNFIEKLITKNLKSNYENKNFNIENQDFYKDFLKIKKLLISENNFLKAIKNIIIFQKEYPYFSDLDSVYDIFGKDNFYELLSLFEKIKRATTKIELKKEFLKFGGVYEITKKLDYFEKAYNFLKEFNFLYKKNIGILDYSTFSFFSNLFGDYSNLYGEQFIKDGLLNIRNNLKIVLKKEKDLGKINHYLEKLNFILKEIEKDLNSIIEIINKVSFNGSYKLRNSQKEVKELLLKLTKRFYGKEDNSKIKNISDYLDGIIYKKYNKAKEEYYDRLNSSSYSYSSGGYSSYDSDSSWSSSSGDFSSDYSSSGDSSW